MPEYGELFELSAGCDEEVDEAAFGMHVIPPRKGLIAY
jgi:hypothetical protein